MDRFDYLDTPDPAGPHPFKAWDRLFRRAVAVKIFARAAPRNGSRDALQQTWDRWVAAPHRGLLRPAILDLRRNILLREWVEGFSLLELLRVRRKLDARETLALLSEAAPLLDHAEKHELLAGAGLDKFLVDFGTAAPPPPETPMPRWTAWHLRLDPLRLGDFTAAPGGETLGDATSKKAALTSAVAALHGLARELLGGAKTRPGTPLAAFGDAANAVLATALKTGAFESATAFAAALRATSPDDRPFASAPVPTGLGGEAIRAGRGFPAPARVLTLEPLGGVARALRIVARTELKIGRSSVQADAVARFPAHLVGCEELAKCLGRIHARLGWIDGGLQLFDGTSDAPSRNGTFTGDGPLSHRDGTSFHAPTVLQLGSTWRATLVPVSLIEAGSGDVSEPGGDTRWGAIFIVPWPDCTVLTETLWLIEEAGFGLTENGALIWDIEGQGSAPAAVRTHAGGFSLENRRFTDGEFFLDSQRLEPGGAVPLRDGMHVAIGAARWRARIE